MMQGNAQWPREQADYVSKLQEEKFCDIWRKRRKGRSGTILLGRAGETERNTQNPEPWS